MFPLRRLPARVFLLAALVTILTGVMLHGEEGKAEKAPKDNTFKGMKWRLIGPFRGGRVLAVAGVPGDPNTYYFGAVAGGVWKS
ncbi:MAG TPA: hypothetical protein VG028_14090, partial [Terriglobia bacterium]|nr:hypothetical protein [Terriglobia bacterium]